jgi:AraC-like DNA-binding protein
VCVACRGVTAGGRGNTGARDGSATSVGLRWPKMTVNYTQSAWSADLGIVSVVNSDHLWGSIKDEFAYSLTIQGKARWFSRGRVWNQFPGVLSLNQPGEAHQEIWRNGPGSFQVLVFRTTFEDKQEDGANCYRNVPSQLHPGQPGYGPLLDLQRLAGTQDRLVGQMAWMEARAALYDLMEVAAPLIAPIGEHHAVLRAKEFVRDHAATGLSMDALATEIGLNKHYLSRVFKRAVGLPPYQFHLHLRISEAKRLLAEGVPASEVAVQLGFCDQSQLHRHFVRLTGVTPGRFAK